MIVQAKVNLHYLKIIFNDKCSCLFSHCIVDKQISFIQFALAGNIVKTFFSLQLMKVPNKLESLSLAGPFQLV